MLTLTLCATLWASGLQVILTAATMSKEHEEFARQWFPHLQRVDHVGVLVPTLRKRFIPVRGFKDEAST